MSYAEERMLVELERIRLSSPDEVPPAPRLYKRFDELTEDQQRAEIRARLEANPEDFGLLGEALIEHKLNTRIASALFANNIEQFGKLADEAIRDYIGKIIQADWNSKEKGL